MAPGKAPQWISSEVLHLIHAQQLERFGGQAGILDRNVVESALHRPRNVHAYGEDVDLADLAAAYLFGFAQKQGFVDGNKRTAVATMLVFLSINGTPLHVPGPELYRIAMAVANAEVEEAEVAEWIRRNLPD